ncbi:MAG: hypothetical protein JNJ88_03380 [Planctomycetes bacterium]|nr:hypothetical protein [Planctomycetota bacterium]
MEITLREAAVLLSRSERTLRAQVSRGELEGRKVHGRWILERRSLPLTDAQRAALDARANAIRDTVERALPARAAISAGDRRRTVLDLDAFRAGSRVLRAMRETTNVAEGSLAASARSLRRALLSMARATHAYDAPTKLKDLRRARAALSVATAQLWIEAGDPPADPQLRFAIEIETHVLPRLRGLLRWAERASRHS